MDKISRINIEKSVYNDEKLLKIKKKELLFLKNKIKEIRRVYKGKIRSSKRIKKRDLYGKSLGYVKQILELPEKTTKERDA